MDAVTHAAMLARGGPLPIMKEEPDADLPTTRILDANGDSLPLDDLLDKHDADGFLMMRHGRIVYERYWNGLDSTRSAYLVFNDQVSSQHRVRHSHGTGRDRSD